MSDRTPRTLLEVQTWMLNAICGAHEHMPSAIVTDGPRLSAHDRLEIYRDGYFARLTECLRDDYPVLAATLGQARFDALCREYIANHPSCSPSLNAFGRHMAFACAETTALEAPMFCSELATLEWALIEVTHAPLPVPLDLDALRRVPPEAWNRARLIGSDALRVLSFKYPVNTHYQSYRADGVLLPLPAAQPSATAVYRRGLVLWRLDLTPPMERVLRALLDGQPIALALARIGVDESDAVAVAEAERSVMVWFSDWISSGFFTRVVIES
jgi:hypothetical protein